MSQCQSSVTYFVFNFPTDLSSLTATSTASGFLLNSLQQPRSSYFWQSTSTSEQIISGSFTSQFINFLVFYDSNLTVDALVTLTLKYNAIVVKTLEFPAFTPVLGYGEGGYGDGLYGGYLEAMPGEKYDLSQHLGEDVFCDEFIISIYDPDNPDGFIRLARFALGFALIPFGGVTPNHSLDFESNAAIFRSEKLGTLSFIGHSAKKLTIECQWLSEEALSIITLKREIYPTKNLYLSVFPLLGGYLTTLYRGLFFISEMSAVQINDAGKMVFTLTCLEDV